MLILASHLLSPTPPMSRSLLSPTLALVITPVSQTSLSMVVLVVACWLGCLPTLSAIPLNCVGSCVRPPPVVTPVRGLSLRGQLDVQN
jgi:hypothetical protein